MSANPPPRPIEEIRATIRARSPFGPERTEEILRARFERIPRRVEEALARWPLASSRVLDVGSSFGHCLIQFGPGSVGIDNVSEHVEFCRAIGLDVLQLDADAGLDAVPDAAFDYVWVSDIIEHLDAPRLLLRRLRAKLAADGELLLHVSTLPAARLARWGFRRRRMSPFDSHVHYYQFTRETAEYLLARAGYRVTCVVAPVPLPLGPLEGVAARNLPRIMLAARPDPAAERIALEGERRNKPPAAAHGTL